MMSRRAPAKMLQYRNTFQGMIKPSCVECMALKASFYDDDDDGGGGSDGGGGDNNCLVVLSLKQDRCTW